jgi:hypothetical protein
MFLRLLDDKAQENCTPRKHLSIGSTAGIPEPVKARFPWQIPSSFPGPGIEIRFVPSA